MTQPPSQPPTPPPAESTPGTGVPTCYRHPGRETYISCQRCGRPICPDCMNEAAVGFQCPECVAEGRRTQRSARTPYGGALRQGRPLVTMTILAINLVLFLLVQVTGGADSQLVYWLSEHARGVCAASSGGGYFPQATGQQLCDTVGGTWVPGVADGAIWQLVTSMFLQVQILHFAFNMLALYVLGPQLETVLGRARFLALYLLAGLTGSAFVYWLTGVSTPTLGASGAIFGLMAALLVIAHRIGADYQQILMWIGLNVVITVIGAGYISWQGHLGGFVGGLVVSGILAYAPRGTHRTLVQVAGMSALGVAVVAAIALRTLTLV